jgi:hypothetical protein
MTHPFDQILEWLPELDFAVLAHGWAKHGRDYLVVVEDCLGGKPGQHEITLTHCVRLEYETRVRDEVFQRSWTDEFTDYKRWQESGEPDGYVWGTDWSDAYPGLEIVRDSQIADEWSARLNKKMHEVTLETDRFFMRIIFHSVRSRKLSESTDTISKVVVPLRAEDSQQAPTACPEGRADAPPGSAEA